MSIAEWRTMSRPHPDAIAGFQPRLRPIAPANVPNCQSEETREDFEPQSATFCQSNPGATSPIPSFRPAPILASLLLPQVRAGLRGPADSSARSSRVRARRLISRSVAASGEIRVRILVVVLMEHRLDFFVSGPESSAMTRKMNIHSRLLPLRERRRAIVRRGAR